jgi:hypothetical protein
MLRRLTTVAAIAATLLVPAVAFAAQNKGSHANKGAHVTRSAPANKTMRVNKSLSANKGVHVNRAVRTNKSVRINKGIHTNNNVMSNQRIIIGHRYHGGVWYGHKRRFWHGQWWAYGIGECWLSTPIGYVWICD